MAKYILELLRYLASSLKQESRVEPQCGIYNIALHNCWWPTVLLSQIAASALRLNLSSCIWQFDGSFRF